MKHASYLLRVIPASLMMLPFGSLCENILQEIVYTSSSVFCANHVNDGLLHLAHSQKQFAREENLQVSPNQHMVAYSVIYKGNVSTNSKIYATKLASKETIEIGRADANNWLPAWSPDGSKLAFYSDDGAKHRIWIYDVALNQSFCVSDLRIRSDRAVLNRALWSPDSEVVYVPYLASQHQTGATFPPSAKNENVIPRVYNGAGEFKDINKSENRYFDSEFAAINVKTRDVNVLVSTPQQLPSVMNVSAVVSQKVLWKGNGTISNVIPLNDNSFLCLYEDLTTPTNIYLFTEDFTKKEQITSLDPRLNELKDISSEIMVTEYTLPNGDIKEVSTTILLPKKAKKGACLPAIVIIYPGEDLSESKSFAGGDHVGMPSFLFLQNGYAVVLPDVTIGPEGQPGNPLQETVNILLPQLYHAGQLGYIDLNRMGIIGHSYGAYGAAGVISATSLFKAAIGIAGSYDLVGGYGYLGDDGGYFYRDWAINQGRMASSPWIDLQRYIDNSPYYQAHKISTPLLLIHGEKDLTCNYLESEKMFTALDSLQREVVLAIYPGQDHIMTHWTYSAAVDAYMRILEFFNQHLRAQQCSFFSKNVI